MGNASRHAGPVHPGNPPDLRFFTVTKKETVLRIGVDKESYSKAFIALCVQSLARLRSDLEQYIRIHPLFRASFAPVNVPAQAPELAKRMSAAARIAKVGPMAAVAGAIAECLGEEAGKHCRDLIIENRGDIYIKSGRPHVIAVFAALTKFSYQIGIETAGDGVPFGICTSAGTVGSGISLGKADAAVIKATTPSLADAAATATANRIKKAEDLENAVRYARQLPGVTGVLVIKDNVLAAWGDLKLVKI